jgi:hypothetical protein
MVNKEAASPFKEALHELKPPDAAKPTQVYYMHDLVVREPLPSGLGGGPLFKSANCDPGKPARFSCAGGHRLPVGVVGVRPCGQPPVQAA